MKLIKIFILSILILNISACAEERNTIKKKGNNVQNILMQNPSFYLEIKGSDTKIQVFINGVKIYTNYSRGDFYTKYPINTSITSGKNEIKMNLIAGKNQEYKLDNKANTKINLIVKSFKTGEEYIISTLKYTFNKDNEIEGSTFKGNYNSLESFVKDKNGNVFVDNIAITSYTMKAGKKYGGKSILQDVYFKTSYPRWKFLDSENIISKNLELYSNEEYDELKQTPAIQELYNIYTQIHTALKNKQPEKIIHLFKERNEEFDLAWDYKPGTVEKSNFEGIKEEIDNPDNELVDFTPSKNAFFIEDNLKLIKVKAIAYNSKKGGSTRFNISFRRENGKWILTR